MLLTRRKANRLDTAGIWVSSACAIHCAVLPVLAAVLGTGIGSFGGDWHTALVVGTIFFALVSVALGIRRHGNYSALLPLAGGILIGILLFLGHEVIETKPFLHGALFAAMGTLMIVAHVLNVKLTHGHMHDSTCHHHH